MVEEAFGVCFKYVLIAAEDQPSWALRFWTLWSKAADRLKEWSPKWAGFKPRDDTNFEREELIMEDIKIERPEGWGGGGGEE